MTGNIYNKFRRITANQLYFPEIDGIRFLAIVMVLLFHLHGYFVEKTTIQFTDNPDTYRLLNRFLENGDRGVELFFVLSGFILCLPFAHQHINKGKQVKLKKYYLRRLTRLEPPYLLAMTGIFVLQLAMHVHPARVLVPSWLASLVYLHGAIYHHTPLLTVVAWSLEIEIQFYLLAPLFFSVLKLPAATRRTLLAAAMAGLIVAQHLSPPSFLNLYGFAQYFFAGILLADLYVSNTASRGMNRRWVTLAALGLFAAIVYLPVKDNALIPAEPTALLASRLVFPFAIAAFFLLVLKNRTLKRMFSYRFVPIIGGMCYTIYLVHYTVISAVGRLTIRLHMSEYYLPNLLLQLVLLAVPVLVVSALFYLNVERPFMDSKWTDMLMKKRKQDADAVMEGERGS